MLNIELIRKKPEWVKEQLEKLFDDTAPPRIDIILELDEKRRNMRTEIEQLQSLRNQLNKKMGGLRGNKKLDDGLKATYALRATQAIENKDYEQAIEFMAGNGDIEVQHVDSKEAFDGLITALRNMGNHIDASFKEIEQIEAEIQENMYWLPNLPHASVPVNESEEHNVPWKPEGEMPQFDFEPKAHWDLAPELGIIDFERGVKLSGARFYILQGWGARLQRALINLFLDMAREKGFTELYVPYLVHAEMLYGSSQLPKFEDTMYQDREAGFYLIPTSEVSITNMHRDEILDEEQLPFYYVAHTPCFRSEKASGGRDVRGIKRVHQFEKVEMYKFTTPETSYAELESLAEAASDICRALKIPFRRLEIVSGDLGFSATKKYDIEMWAPGCGEWLEVSSCSNTEDFQARRAEIKYRPTDNPKQKHFVHTLNGSGLGLTRVIIAIMENYQQADGSILIPEVLRPYMGNIERITKA